MFLSHPEECYRSFLSWNPQQTEGGGNAFAELRRWKLWGPGHIPSHQMHSSVARPSDHIETFIPNRGHTGSCDTQKLRGGSFLANCFVCNHTQTRLASP